MNYPQVPHIESASELLDFILHPDKYAKLLDELVKLRDEVNEGLKKLKAHDSIDKQQRVADEKMRAANEYLAQAEQKKAELIHEANRKAGEVEKHVAQMRAQQDLRGQELETKLQHLLAKEKELKKREEAVARDLAEAEKKLIYAQGVADAANHLREEYEERRRKLLEAANAHV